MKDSVKSFERYESEVRSYSRHFPKVFVNAKDATITDEDGKEYIDFFCGAGAVNYGHNNTYIKQKVVDYLATDGIIHALDMFTAPKREFIETLEQKIIEPRGLHYKIQFCGPTGTNAVEAAIKLARKNKGRDNIFAFMGCFHGMTLGALSLTSEMYARRGAGVSLNDVTHIPAPYMFEGLDVIAYMQTLLDDDHSGVEKPAAVVMETLQAEGGIRPFSNEFLQEVRAFCDKNDILLIIDDIQVGCCRTGDFFSFERAGIVPDMVVMSKSIGGMGMPLAIVLLKEDLDIWKPAEHNGTFRGNQLSFIAGKASFDWLLENHVEAETKRKGSLVEDFITKEILPLDDRLEMRGLGLIWGIDFSGFEADITERIIETCFENKLICEAAGRNGAVLKIMPPLVIEDALLQKGLEIVAAAIKEVIGK
ncbi:MAG: diaminobutyrate--2-oxoglutarate transaminase [Clostridia bacterium]|nr:diaminobutyrate--2-oxoglutarate transaminase [Clostridia bacterium]